MTNSTNVPGSNTTATPLTNGQGATQLNCFVMVVTPFTSAGKVDWEATRHTVRRLADAKVGLLLGSGGAGEGHALSLDELQRVYEIGVEECKGRVPVHANLPEQHTAAATRPHLEAALSAGIEVVHLYTLEGRHGMRPTDAELMSYFDTVLASVVRPVALAINTTLGYAPKPTVIAEICRRHEQIVAVRMSNVADIYLIELQRLIKRDMQYFVMLPGSLNPLVMGASGIFGVEANILPRTFRRYVDQFAAGDFAGLAKTYADLRRFDEYTKTWNPSTPRWLKMAMLSLKLPGGEGGVREPYLMPGADEIARFTDGLLRLGIPEIEDMARTAGLELKI